MHSCKNEYGNRPTNIFQNLNFYMFTSQIAQVENKDWQISALSLPT